MRAIESIDPNSLALAASCCACWMDAGGWCATKVLLVVVVVVVAVLGAVSAAGTGVVLLRNELKEDTAISADSGERGWVSFVLVWLLLL